MKAIIGIAAVAVVATFTLMRAIGADAPSRPPGVSPSEWAPITDTIGVVLVAQQMTAADAPELAPDPASGRISRNVGGRPTVGAVGGAALIAPVTGYLMVKRGSLWQRLIVIEPVKGPGAAG